MKIVVLGGGLSTEREVSLASATSVCRALRSRGHQAVFVDTFLGLEGFSGEVQDIFDAEDGLCDVTAISETAPDIEAVIASRELVSRSRLGYGVMDACAMADCVYLGLHGADGEDGKIQAMLELLGVPYTGSGPLGSAMAMDKGIAKKILCAAGVRTPEWKEFNLDAIDNEDIIKEVSVPCVIKIINGGSSIGVYVVDSEQEAMDALEESRRFGNRIIVENKIIGRELTVPVLGAEVLSPIEIVPPESGSFDYVAKYQNGHKAALELCPAPIDEATKRLVQEMAMKAHEALGLSVVSRTDFIVDQNGDAWCLEVNTLPGMTQNSLLPKAACLAGMEYSELCEKIVQLSLAKA